ncbi:flavodoxin-dependent (E)-4-hydroxy-3-methylbut-2-enyl-diphosphate synthase [Candidatus Woesearchaeota archaeon]|nr:flavodoxin-dependent (E)-4-hydroxy-3-methylbut-2-enyl-diphosphate synthase [Candidatus Woesearchaeota archaeon]
MRRKSIDVRIGSITIGGNNPVAVQSMTNTVSLDETLKQVNALEGAGCEIVRLAVPDENALGILKAVKKQTELPVVADIHFDYKLAIESAKIADKIRINPGNIGNEDSVRKVIEAAKDNSIPIRVGVNSGSIEKKFQNLQIEDGLVKSAMEWINFIEENDFRNIVLSLKSTDIITTINANRKIAKLCSYPIHLGITEAGTFLGGTIASSVALGTLLLDGIGDTIRISLTANPVEEVKVGIEMLKQLGLREGIRVISCPTCARTEFDVIGAAEEVNDAVRCMKRKMTVAVMGCPVNGMQEAAHADIGVTANRKEGILFKKGKVIRNISKDRIAEELLKEIQ